MTKLAKSLQSRKEFIKAVPLKKKVANRWYRANVYKEPDTGVKAVPSEALTDLALSIESPSIETMLGNVTFSSSWDGDNFRVAFRLDF